MNNNFKNEKSFMFYPEITDSNFNEKIYLKKEFRDTEIKTKSIPIKEHQGQREFLLESHQVFLKNYISPDTPYNGILVFHGTGVGKTCTAISIAEGFKKTLKNLNKKILILTTLPNNFINELFDSDRERRKKNPDDIVQCTGREYELGDESLYLTRLQKEKALSYLKRKYYQFFGYQSFANYIINNTQGWSGKEEDLNDKIKKFISKEFDNRVIIIDEIQNIKTTKQEGYTKDYQPILKSIIKYGKNIKLVLMSATPMFDRPDEIIFYINLLLLNDKRPEIDRSSIFNSQDGTLKADADKKLREIFTGYVSYVRGERPYIFPFRINPKEAILPKITYSITGNKLDNNKKIKYTKLILCPMEGVQEKTYEYYAQKKIKEGIIKKDIDNKDIYDDVDLIENIKEDELSKKKDFSYLLDLTDISNIVYPELEMYNDNNSNNNNSNNNNNHNLKLDKIGSFGKKSIDVDYDNGIGGYYRVVKKEGSKNIIKYRYQEHSIFDRGTKQEKPFADEKHLNKYSIKFAKILETIKKSKGLIFVFSQFIEQGTLPFALMLEQNGFSRECTDDEQNLLEYPANKLKGGGKRKEICYLCGHDQDNIEHKDQKNKNYHVYHRAKYIIVFGDSKRDIIKVKKTEALRKFSSEDNKNGELIKVFIGTKIISEGLNFKRLRQVHIIDPWFNLSRHEQIIGRAIRNLSHSDLAKEERNVEIFQYAATYKGNKSIYETVDLKNYRIAELKDIIIKDISRIMKESAVDCALFKKSNIIESSEKEKQITSSGEVVYVPIADKEYSQICDYKNSCNYTCNWEPNPKKNYPINTDTYNMRFAINDIEKVKKYIKNLFKINIVYDLALIEKLILRKIPDSDKIFIYSALEMLVDNKNEIIHDKFNRDGYLIYRGNYYIFQPFDLERTDLPLIYRMNPESIKYHDVSLDKIEVDYNENNNNLDKKNKFDEIGYVDSVFEEITRYFNIYKNIYLEKYDKYVNEYIYAIIGTIYDKLNKQNEIIFINNILKRYLKILLKKEKNEEKYRNYVLQTITFLNDNNRLINYYADIDYEKSKIDENFFVGYIVNNEYFILDNLCRDKPIKQLDFSFLDFVPCTKDIISKIKSYRLLKIKMNNKKEKKYNIVYGILEINNKKYSKKFKIVDKSFEEKILTKEKEKSKRTIITGRQCSTFEKKKLLEIRDKIGMYKYESSHKIIIEYMCIDIEIFFRFKQKLNLDNKIWFEVIEE